MGYYKPEELAKMRTTLKQAKNNPNDPRSQEIFKRINEGKMNFELKALGLPTVDVPRPKIDMQAAMAGAQQVEGRQTMIPGKTALQKAGEFVQEGIQDVSQGFIDGVKAFGQAGQDIVQTASRDDRNLAEKATIIGGRAFSGGSEGIFDPLLGVAKAFLPQSVEDDIAKATAQLGKDIGARLREIYQDAKEGKGETQLVRALNAFAVKNIDMFIDSYQNNERFREQVNAALGFSGGLIPPAAKGTVTTAREVGGALGTASRDAAGMALTGAARAVETVTPVIQTAGERAVGGLGRKADELFATTEQQAREQIQAATARITGGKPDDIADAAEAMKLIAVNPDNVTSYQDLVGTVKGNIKAVSEAQDFELAQYTERYTPDTTATYEKVGDVTVSTTPVRDALDGLETAYTKSGEAAKAERIRQLRNQFETDGLTVLELNQLAREYGIEFKDRAFSKTGDAKTGYNAEAFENIRSGLKDVVRERLPDDYSKELDTKLTQLYVLDRLTADMYNKVFTRLNKMPKATVGRMVSQSILSVVDVADMLTGRIAGNLMREIVRRSGVAQKNFLNPIELEKELQKSLKEINKLMDIQDNKRFEKAFTDWYNNLPIGMSIRAVDETPGDRKIRREEEEIWKERGMQTTGDGRLRGG